MRYIILSDNDFSSTKRDVAVFYHFTAFIFCLFLRIMFAKKAFGIVISKMKLLRLLTTN